MRIKTAVILPNIDNSFKSAGTHTSRPFKRRIEEEKEQINTEEDMIRILLIAITAATVLGFPWFRNDIPNGNNVPNPCAGQAGVWQGVGHDKEPGGGPRNPFGLDFKNAGFKWTKELCQKDSDQDGRTNGDELGDKNCTWSTGGTPSTGATGHPGICEPMTDAKCTTLNKDIKCTQNEKWCIFGHCI